ncbi:MAG: MFS transporter [Alphaproteobacteria bacterium]|nr:MFS transporter [Alphaproteobacteria bacterium]MDX5369524.1 MFS transporter [Alphaproteobacteria bacterium]MDX5464182.1 MFS transporter [Alphaproteobacteria bacterium]
MGVSLLYAAVFGHVGAFLPFFPVWLEGRGLTPGDIGLFLGLVGLTRIVAGPGVALLIDRSGSLIRSYGLISVVGTLVLLCFVPGVPPLVLLAMAPLLAAFLPTLIPLNETIALRTAADTGASYGVMRAVGSAAFILAAIGCGWTVGMAGPEAVIWWMVITAALAAAGSLIATEPRPQPRGEGEAEPKRARLSDAGRLLRSRPFLMLALGGGLIQAGHAVYYAFSALHWRRLGYDETTIGLLWGVGVVAEVLLFAFAGRVGRWFGPLALVLIGGLGASVRWLGLAFDPPLWALFVLQTGHALSFGATHLGAVQFLHGALSPRLGVTGQTLYNTISGGILLAGATAGMGLVFDRLGALSYLAMAAMTLAGTLVTWRLMRTWRPA